MNEQLFDKIAYLKQRNARTRYYKSMREKGIIAPEDVFFFLDFEQGDEVINRVRSVTSTLQDTKCDSTSDARRLAVDWLTLQRDVILLAVPDVGVLVGARTEFFSDFFFFEPLMSQILLFTNPRYQSGFQCVFCEQHFYITIW